MPIQPKSILGICSPGFLLLFLCFPYISVVINLDRDVGKTPYNFSKSKISNPLKLNNPLMTGEHIRHRQPETRNRG